MSEWVETTLGEIADVTKLAGFEYTKYFEYIEDGEIIALRALNVRNGSFDLSNIKTISQEVSDLLPRSKLFKDDILFTYVGANIGQFALVGMNDKYHLAPNICRIRADDNSLYPYFLYSYFRSSIFKDDLENFSVGSSQPTMPMGNVRKIPILLPPLPEQKAIAAVLSSLDDKIDLLHRQNKTLESIAETLFRQWFIEEAQDDWEEGTLGSLIKLHYGKALKKSLRTGYGYPVVGSSGIVDYHSEAIVQAPGIVIGRKGTLGKVIYLSESFYPIDTTYYVEAKPKIGFSFLFYLLNSIDFKEMNTDSAVPGLNRNIALGVEMLIPPLEKIKKFEKIIDSAFKKIEYNKKQIKTLERMRDTLLPKLMSGDIRVKYEVEA